MCRIVLGVVLTAVPLLLFACGQAAAPSLLPPYDGPLKTGQENPTGYQPGSVDIHDLVGGITGVLPGTVIDMTTPGYYNNALGSILDGTDPAFPVGGTPAFVFTTEPSLAAASSILGPWLSSLTMPPNANWTGPAEIPQQWEVLTETAVIYSIVNPGPFSWKLRGSFGVDNGIFVWLDGVFVFGAIAEGSWKPYEYPDIDLGVIGPGQHFLQVLREDHSVVTGYWIEVKTVP